MQRLKSKRLFYLKQINSYITGNKKMYVYMAAIKLVITLIALIPPIIYKYYINQVILDGKLSNMIIVIAGYVLIYVMQSILLVFSKYIDTKLTSIIKLDLKRRLLGNYTTMQYEDYESKDIGDIRLRIESDISAICTYYANHCLNYFFSIIYSIIVLFIIFSMNWYLTLFGLVMIIISYFITRVLGEKIKRTADVYRTEQGEFDSIIHEAFQKWKEIKINNLEEKELEQLSDKWHVLSKSVLKRTKYQYLHGALIAFNLFFVTRMNLYFFGGLLIINNLMSIPVMLVFISYYEQLYEKIQIILDSTISLNSDIPQIERVLEVLKYSNRNVNDADVQAIADNQLCGDLRLNNVCYKYKNTNRPSLKKIDLTIPLNKSLAIIGKSGSGKTTLIKILSGLYQPSTGSIDINGINYNCISDYDKCHFINIVMQDPQLFNMSILDNLYMAYPDASIEEIDNACKKANIYEFIQSLPNKYNTLIGEHGIKLSGGQCQRLAIARALLLDPKVLIFDEATASLDSENETAIVNSIEEMSKEKTIITISHRFSTISKSDNVIIVEEGQIIENGNMETVKNESKIFASIFNNTEYKCI